ncbi:hypothetical protein EDB86DRAFT_1462903 [Lactarius hatsudake]|nr:hypothetical protein EDB86DRAFT_1462903 [Lactarius hatsudake]
MPAYTTTLVRTSTAANRISTASSRRHTRKGTIGIVVLHLVVFPCTALARHKSDGILEAGAVVNGPRVLLNQEKADYGHDQGCCWEMRRNMTRSFSKERTALAYGACAINEILRKKIHQLEELMVSYVSRESNAAFTRGKNCVSSKLITEASG